MQKETGGVGDVTGRYLEDNIRLWGEYAEGLRRISEGRFLPSTSAQPRDSGALELGERARELVELSVTHYASLLSSYADFASRFTQAVLRPSAASRGTSASGAETGSDTEAANQLPVRIELSFTGRFGETASQSFAVVNRRAEDLDVAFELTEFVREDGRHRFRAPVTFVPDTFLLAPGREQVVECRIRLGEPFTPGARHVAMVRVPGFPDVHTVLLVMPQPLPERTAAATHTAKAAPVPTRSSKRIAKERSRARSRQRR